MSRPRKSGEPSQEYPPEARAAAFQTWLENDAPSFRELVELMKAQGINVNLTTLHRWKESNPAWIAAFLEKAAPIDPSRIIAALNQAKADAKTLDADHLMGIKVQLIARLYLTIKDMEFKTVDEWERALGCCDRLEALIHAERGKAVSDRAPTASLMQALSPPVNIAPFKKPIANGNGANGSGH